MVADNLAVETVVHLECLACNPSVDTYRMVLPLAYQPSVRHMVAGHIHTLVEAYSAVDNHIVAAAELALLDPCLVWLGQSLSMLGCVLADVVSLDTAFDVPDPGMAVPLDYHVRSGCGSCLDH
jgi:hypothetical protein